MRRTRNKALYLGTAREGRENLMMRKTWDSGAVDRISRQGIVIIPMDFEFDPQKSAANKEKHGIDFIEATLT